jgi:hypothetical protein
MSTESSDEEESSSTSSASEAEGVEPDKPIRRRKIEDSDEELEQEIPKTDDQAQVSR